MAENRERQLSAAIYGRVQGVGFRQFVRHEARRLGLKGWVRNRADGSVEAVAEGPEPRLQLLLRLMARGPELSQVDRVESAWSEGEGSFTGFEIRY